jgi:hypothetical protein
VNELTSLCYANDKSILENIMTFQLKNLDDRKYKNLVDEATGIIPTYAPDWTNHNPSDPGITLIEMFAYLTELLLYRLNRVTEKNIHSFLKLLNGPEWKASEEKNLTDEIRDTVQGLRKINRAVTGEDFENLSLAADVRVARTRCVPRRDLESENPLAATIKKPGHISVIIVPRSEESNPQPDGDLIQTVRNYLEPRRLLTTRVHVVGPRYFTIGIRITLFLKPDALEDQVRSQAVRALQKFFRPVADRPDKQVWPFGRNVYVSEIYEILDTLAGVDYVLKPVDPATKKPLDEITVAAIDSHRLERDDQGGLVAVEILPDELIDARIVPDEITVKSPTGL